MCILLCRIFILMLTIKILWVVTKLSHLCIRWYFEIRWSIIRKPAFFLTKNKNIQGDTYGYFYIYYWFMLYQGTVVWLHFCVSRTRILSYALKIRVLYASKKRVATPIVILVSLAELENQTCMKEKWFLTWHVQVLRKYFVLSCRNPRNAVLGWRNHLGVEAPLLE